MLIRLFGAAALLGFALFTARHLERLYRTRILQLEGFLLLLRTTREKILAFGTPTPEIFSVFRHDALEEAGFLPTLREEGMAAALRAARERLYLDDGEMAPLLDFAASLGRSFAAEEATRCDVTIAAVERALAARSAAEKDAAKLSRTLVLGASLAFILVLL